MKALTFKRGIHPPDNKHHTASTPIETIMPVAGEQMLFSLQHHIGAPCAPIVEVGERVLVGQKIADSDAFVSSPVHSSVSGTVTGITETLIPTGAIVKAIAIENDGEFLQHEKARALDKPKDDYLNAKPAEILAAIREAGIVGLGGAGFPSHIKLNPPKEKRIDHVLINAAECEPFLTNDYRVMLEKGDRLLRGLQIVLRLFPGAKGVIGIESNKMEAVKQLQGLCAADKNCQDIRVVALQTKYPQGAEKQLISACVSREVPSGGLPADAGCIVQNVGTVVSLEEALCRNMPLMRRVITICGGAVRKPGNYRVPVGMSYSTFLDAAGGLKAEPAKIISGGPMMGVALPHLDIPVIKISSAILCLTDSAANIPAEQGCIRCARCVEHCPVGLLPLDLNQYAVRGNDDAFRKNNGMDCIECGSCSYICPAKRHLTQSVRSVRRRLLAAARK